MKKIFIFLLLLAFVTPCLASTYVRGYTRRDGTYVQGHYRSNADSTKLNNYSTQGNYNPYTGQQGYRTYSNYNNTGRNYNNYNNYNYGY